MSGGRSFHNWLLGALRSAALTRDPDSAGLPGSVEVVRGDLFHPRHPSGKPERNQGDLLGLALPHRRSRARASGCGHRIHPAHRLPLIVRDDLAQQADPISSFHADVEHSGLERTTFLRSGGMATNTLMWGGADPHRREGDPLEQRPGR